MEYQAAKFLAVGTRLCAGPCNQTPFQNTNYYRLIAVDHAGNQSGYSVPVEATLLSIENGSVPLEFTLHQNHPNPFNPTTYIEYELQEEKFVNVIVHDILGNIVNILFNDFNILASIQRYSTVSFVRCKGG